VPTEVAIKHGRCGGVVVSRDQANHANALRTRTTEARQPLPDLLCLLEVSQAMGTLAVKAEVGHDLGPFLPCVIHKLSTTDHQWSAFGNGGQCTHLQGSTRHASVMHQVGNTRVVEEAGTRIHCNVTQLAVLASDESHSSEGCPGPCPLWGVCEVHGIPLLCAPWRQPCRSTPGSRSRLVDSLHNGPV